MEEREAQTELDEDGKIETDKKKGSDFLERKR